MMLNKNTLQVERHEVIDLWVDKVQGTLA